MHPGIFGYSFWGWSQIARRGTEPKSPAMPTPVSYQPGCGSVEAREDLDLLLVKFLSWMMMKMMKTSGGLLNKTHTSLISVFMEQNINQFTHPWI